MSAQRQTRLVLAGFLILSLGPAAWVVATDFTTSRTGLSYGASAIAVALVLAVVPFRQTWAWWIMAILQGAGAAAIIGGGSVLWFLDAILLFLILISPQMRDWVGVDLSGSRRRRWRRETEP
jgi:hypothetical protein